MRTLFVLVAVLIAPSLAHAQAACTPSTFAADQPNDIPKGFTAKDNATLITSEGKVAAQIPIQAATGKFTVTSAALLTKNMTVRGKGPAACRAFRPFRRLPARLRPRRPGHS